MKKHTLLMSSLCLLLALVCALACSCDTAAPTESSAPSGAVQSMPSETSVASVAAESSQPKDIPLVTDYQECFAGMSLHAKHIAVYDTSLHSILFSSGGMDERIYPASITKLYSAYVALQILDPASVVTVGDELQLVQPHSSLAYLSKGNRLRVDMVVEGMLLPSGNDAAYVLAAAAGYQLLNDPSASAKQAVQAFVDEMNRKAAEDGLTNTHFTAPDGFHDPNHYTCVSDLLIIAEKVLQCETIMRYASLASDKVLFASGETVTWENSNQLIRTESEYYRADVIGLKTGFTDEAGRCVLAAAKSGERVVIIAVLGCENGGDQFADAAALLDRYTAIPF